MFNDQWQLGVGSGLAVTLLLHTVDGELLQRGQRHLRSSAPAQEEAVSLSDGPLEIPFAWGVCVLTL